MLNLLKRAYIVYQAEGLRSLFYKFISYFSLNKIIKKNLGIPIQKIGDIVPNDNNLVLFGTKQGRLFEDNSKYVYEWVLENEPELRPVWVAHETKLHRELSDQGLPVVSAYSLRGIYNLMRASSAVFTHSLNDIAIHSSFVPDSITRIMVGHGNPVKSNPSDEKTVHKHRIRHRSIDYIIESSEFMKENSLKTMSVNDDPNEVNSRSRKKHVVTGYPRHDLLLNIPNETKSIWEEFLDGMNPESVILYAPTNHPICADSEETAVDFFPFDDFNRNELYTLLEKNNALLLFRPHPVDVRNMRNYSYGAYQRMQDQLEWLCADSKRVRMATQYEIADTTQLLPFIDILITDYSSIYHDYLLLDRPIIFIPDRYELFEKEKGFRYDYFEHLPGPPVETFSNFTNEIQDIYKRQDNYRSDRLDLKKKVHKFSDGCCRQRVVELIKNA